MRTTLTLLLSALVTVLGAGHAAAQRPPRADDDPRVTPTVKLVRQCLPSVVSIRVLQPTQREGVMQLGHGGGSVIHEDGYILTNTHVVDGGQRVEVAFFLGQWLPARVVALLPQEDLALLKINVEKPLPALPLGRSDDLELGEPVITFGSPGGLPHSLSTGLISGLGRATQTERSFLPSMVQTTAAVSGGSSGGPLINALGQQIGVITSRKADGENLGFAITVDRVRQAIPRLIAAEQRYGIAHGMAVDTLHEPVKVVQVATDSSAAAAGVKAGDLLLAVDGKPLHHGVDFYLALVDRKPGDKLPLRVRRGEEELDVPMELGKAAAPSPVEVENVELGLLVSHYEGQWDKLPDFSKLEPNSTEVKASLPWIDPDPKKEHFGVTLTGFIKIPKSGIYAFGTTSDDGSRLWIGETLLINNDGLHAARTAAGLVRLEAGFYPLRVEYFEATGDQALVVSVAGPDGKPRPVPKKWLFHMPVEAPPNTPAEPAEPQTPAESGEPQPPAASG